MSATRIEIHYVPDDSLTFAKEIHLTVVTGDLEVAADGQIRVLKAGDTYIQATPLTVT